MLPPSLASLNFADNALGSDPALAARTASAAPGGRVLVLGGSRPGLLTALTEQGCDVVVVDSSRTALRRTAAVLGDRPSILLLADDPRDMTVPGGADVALLTSAVWRALLFPIDRTLVLRSIANTLGELGRLFVEVEIVETMLGEAPVALPAGASEGTWWHAASDPAHTLRARAGDAGDAGEEALFASFSYEIARDELRASGFDGVTAIDPRTGAPASADTQYTWLSASVRSNAG